MPTRVSSFFQLPNGRIHYIKIGNGFKLLIAFHGYGNDASMFLPLSDYLDDKYTLVSINLPHHGESMWSESARLTIEDVGLLLQHLMIENRVNQISMIGYSMGGRVCLSVLENMSGIVENCLLIASDGLVFNPFYYFATHTSLGNFLLKRFVQYPYNYIRFFKWLRKRKWIDAARFKFIMSYINSLEERQFLYKVWPALSLFIPNRKQLQTIIQQHNIQLIVFSGVYDRVIPPKHAVLFKRLVPSCKLIMLEKGHRIYDSETWEKINDYL